MKKTTVAAAASAIFIVQRDGVACSNVCGRQCRDTVKGKVLVNANGMTLYTFDRDDASGQSNCNGKCAANWPPFAPAADATNAGNWSVIVRNDGSKQWAYKGKPLYTWMDDKRPGDIEGDGRNNVWHVAVP